MSLKKANNSTQAGLTEQFVAFVDLLGFQEEMLKVVKNPEQAQTLLASFQADVAQTVRKVLVPSEPWQSWNYRGFTDNFVIAIPSQMHDDDDGENWFGMITMKIAEFQFRLALKGWFVRGGLTLGKFFMDDIAVFGPALVDAYLLESKHARDPRIVLSQSVADLARDHLKYYDSGYDSPQNKTILIDADGHPFINYLFDAIDGYEDEEGLEDGLERVRRHKLCVEDKLKKHQGDPSIWAKYRWVAGYHDFFCKTWLPKHKDKLTISSTALAASPRRFVDKP